MAETLHIKNMVCPRCIAAVQQILYRLGIEAENVELGTAVLREPLSAAQRKSLRLRLQENGFELLDDRRRQLVDKICTEIIERVHYRDSDPALPGPAVSTGSRTISEDYRVNLSDYLVERCGQDYSALSKLFSEVKGISIEKYYIAQKIERVKELLVYDELSVSEIADRLNYSSVAHLSAQFKAVTGFSPSAFKKLRHPLRRSLDEI